MFLTWINMIKNQNYYFNFEMILSLLSKHCVSSWFLCRWHLQEGKIGNGVSFGLMSKLKNPSEIMFRARQERRKLSESG